MIVDVHVAGDEVRGTVTRLPKLAVWKKHFINVRSFLSNLNVAALAKENKKGIAHSKCNYHSKSSTNHCSFSQPTAQNCCVVPVCSASRRCFVDV